MVLSKSPPGTALLCVVPSRRIVIEDGSDDDEIGAVVVDGCRANNASRSTSSSPANDGDVSEVDDCSLADDVTLGMVVMAEVAEVGVASGPKS